MCSPASSRMGKLVALRYAKTKHINRFKNTNSWRRTSIGGYWHQPQRHPRLGMALGCRLHNPGERPEEGGGHARALWAEAPSLLQSQRSWVWVLRDSAENGQRKVTAAPSAWKTKTNVSRQRSLRVFMSQKYWDYLNTANYFNVCCSFLHHWPFYTVNYYLL